MKVHYFLLDLVILIRKWRNLGERKDNRGNALVKSFNPNISGSFFQREKITFRDPVVIASNSLMKNPDGDSKVQDVAEG